MTFSSDSRTLASASCDGTILLWEIPNGEVPQDVNGDGSVNLNDLMFVANRFGHVGEGDVADVNEDGVVNILDLVAISRSIK